MRRLWVALLLVLLGLSPVLQAQEVTITNVSMGKVGWSGPSLGYYQVEWAPSADGPWSRSWQGLGDRVASSEKTATVPAFYRVVWTLTPESGIVRNETIGTTMNGLTGYSGHLIHHDLATGSVNIVTGGIVLSDGGDGTLSGSGGVSGTINYQTGFWSADFGGSIPESGAAIQATYALANVSSTGTEIDVTGEVLGAAADGQFVYSGTVANAPVVEGSVVISMTGYVFTDQGDGTLLGSVSGTSGTINYSTGAWSFDLVDNYPAIGATITAAYTYLTD